MPLNTDYSQLEELASSAEPSQSQIQNIFDILIFELSKYLDLDPVYKNVEVCIASEDIPEQTNEVSILDLGVIRTSINSALKIEIRNESSYYLPLLLLRETYYCFIPPVSRDSIIIKICINQIIENDLEKAFLKKEVKQWHDLVRDNLVNRDFLIAHLDKLKKHFKTEVLEENQPDTIQHFFRYIHENLSSKYSFEEFYDNIFEDYNYITSRSLFNPEIIETLRILIHIFYETKSYLSLTDYQTLFKEYKKSRRIDTDLSVRKFTEHLQWINKCSPVAPSYDYYYNIVGFYGIFSILKFNPLLDKLKIHKIIERWPFFYLSKISANSFGLELSVTFHVPKVYLRDFISYFNKLEEYGYLIEKKLYCMGHKIDFMNLNYFTDISNVSKIIDLHNINYKKKYEIEFNIEYPPSSHHYPLSIFNYAVLERSRSLSVTGLTFDKRRETLNAIREDVENELRTQNAINKEFKNSLEKVINSPQLRNNFLAFIEKNKAKGFFFTHSQLSQILRYLEIAIIVLNANPTITNIYQLQSSIEPQLIEDHVLLHDSELSKIISRDFLPFYFQSKKSFGEEVEKIQSFYDVLDACYNLKIINLDRVKNIVKEPHLVEEIYYNRETKYDDIFKPFSKYKITNEKIESTIETFLHHEPPLSKPWMIGSILTSVLSDFYPEIILEDTPEVHKKIKQIRSYFPRMYIYRTTELYTKKKLIRILIYSVNFKEKRLFSSIIYSYFGHSLIDLNRYFWGGLSRRVRYGVRDFYDFEKGEFFYTEDLHKEILKYSHILFGGKIKRPKYSRADSVQELFWTEEKTMDDLVDAIKHRVLHQDIDFTKNKLSTLSRFIQNLEEVLLNPSQFRDVKDKDFYQRYIKSIKFIPAFHKFGFSQYCLFFRPFFYRSSEFDIDFKLLFINSFQNIKYPASIESNPALFGEYIFPFRTPNKAYLNWLVKSKKCVAEYCLFYKKKLYDIFHLNRNLSKEGWKYSHIQFKSYMQDVLFKSNYSPELSGVKVFDLSEISDSKFYGPDTQEHGALTDIYNTQSLDIKSYLGTRQYSVIDKITDLIKKKLIFPFVSLKNLDLQQKISLIIPDTKPEFNDKILKIFSFFNICRIYEIEGEFFIYGFEKERVFDGLLIELWLPKCEIDEFFNIFDLLFQYLGIKHYIILTDLVNGKSLLKSVYGNLDFLKEYNPLLNLMWNEKDKIWMNHKLFNEKMEKIYPELSYGKNDNRD